MVDFTLSPQQAAVHEMAAGFAATHLVGAHAKYSKHSTQQARFGATRDIYRTAVRLGLLQAMIPVPLGGKNTGSMLDTMILIEELFAVEPSAALNIFATGLGLSPLMIAGSAEQRAKFLTPFLDVAGDPVASLVSSEPNGTANWLEKGGKGLQTTAQKSGDQWIINGEKIWASTSSGWDDRGADLQCLVCRRVGEEDASSLLEDPASAIMVIAVTREDIANNPADAYSVLRHPETRGLTASTGPHVRFSNLRVPDANVLAPPGKGALLVEQCFTPTAAMVGAMAVGIMRAIFDAALAFAKADGRGGSKPIINHQSVADLLMSIKMRADACRVMSWKAAHALEHGLGLDLALEAKIFCSDAAVKCATEAMSAVGMSSYDEKSPFPRLMNDALCLPLFDGGNVGIRRRQLEKLFQAPDYQPWASTYGTPRAATNGH